MTTTISIEVINAVKNYVAETGDYEVFTNESDVRAYMPQLDELDEPMPEIWVKRIAACHEIITRGEYPVIFDAANATEAAGCYIDDNGFKFDGEYHTVIVTPL